MGFVLIFMRSSLPRLLRLRAMINVFCQEYVDVR